MARIDALAQEQIHGYRRDGYVVVRSFLGEDAVAHCLKTCEQDPRLSDGYAIWNFPEDGIYGRIACLDRLVRAMEQILDGEVYLYQSKIMSKAAANSGLFEWHQDYGYWYRFALLYPLLASCMISLSGATRSNGCLQVLRGSHEMGRVHHDRIGNGKLAAEEERVREAMKRHERVYMEMEPGDAVFFHCNLLHASDANESGRPRWTLISCYNAARNNPYKSYEETFHTTYSPVTAISDQEISRWLMAQNS